VSKINFYLCCDGESWSKNQKRQTILRLW